jgi:putative spermidine/putrescine transport system substrate-binding protein
MNRISKLAGLAAGVALAATACGSSGSKAPAAGATDWSKTTTAAAGGGFDALVAAAQKEGHLNAITLPRSWANYGKLMDDFTKKYGIQITDTNPDGSSGDEINAIQHQKGLAAAPDVVDVGNSHALPNVGLFAPYKVQTWNDIPDALKAADGTWFGDYGGYITIACDPAKISGAACPKTFADLAAPANAAAYKGKIAINGDPTSANAAFSGVWAAALANGGSLDNIQPGIDFFAKLKSAGVFNATHSTESTIEQGSTPISIDWEFNNSQYAADLKAKGLALQVAVPTDGAYSAYYDQAVNKYAPHPAAARLWEEYLYSTVGQNDFMGGYARPVEFTALQTANQLNATDLANLPKATGTPQFPSATQLTAAQNTVTAKWAAALG